MIWVVHAAPPIISNSNRRSRAASDIKAGPALCRHTASCFLAICPGVPHTPICRGCDLDAVDIHDPGVEVSAHRGGPAPGGWGEVRWGVGGEAMALLTTMYGLEREWHAFLLAFLSVPSA
jgi:hypothetical protein